MEDKLKKLGKTLRELRIQNKLSFREADRLSGVDISSISRLEEGKSNRFNFLTLNKLARAYKVNPLSLLKIIDYISEEDIKQYINIAENENISINNDEIEIFNERCSSYYPKKFIKIPDLNCDRAIEIENYIFLYDENCLDLNNNDLGIFNLNNKMTVAFYYCLDNITLKNYFTEEISMHESVEIIGKIKGFINLFYNK